MSTVDSEWLERNRTTVYSAINILVLLGSCIGAAVQDMPLGVAVYVCALVGLCSAPLLFMKRFNDRYALLAMFMVPYFFFYGALDLKILLAGTDVPLPARTEFLTSAELAILVGAASMLLGYTAGAAGGYSRERQGRAAEWPMASVLLVGLALWLVGTAASAYFQIVVTPSKLGFEAAHERASLSPEVMFLLMLCQMMQPLGILILAYGYAKYGRMLWTSIILTVVATQVVVGFIEDVKYQAMIGAAMVIMARTVVTGRLPKAWIAYLAVFVVVAFPIFQAYRVEVTGERGLDRSQALQHLDKVLEIVMASREKVTEGPHRSEGFLERASSKNNLEILFEHVGKNVPYLYGRSLVAIPMALVPRLLVPDKEDYSVGLMFAKQILHADSGVYISITHLGELYWNFGWAGVSFGMVAFGMLLGFVGGKLSLEKGVTLTRVLALLATVQPLCIQFEGTMPVSYLVWIRAMTAIGFLHLVFARKGSAPATVVRPERELPPEQPALRGGPLSVALPLPAPAPRFPNLLR